MYNARADGLNLHKKKPYMIVGRNKTFGRHIMETLMINFDPKSKYLLSKINKI
jgi:hypothetical protein